MPLVDYARSRRPILDVDLDADPFDRWREIGRHTVMTRFHRGGGHSIGIAPLGCVGILSAMRPEDAQGGAICSGGQCPLH